MIVVWFSLEVEDSRVFFFFFFWPMPHSLRDLSTTTRDQT